MAEGNGGLTKVVLKHACGSQAEARGPRTGSCARRRARCCTARACLRPCARAQLYLFGGVITSWTQPSGDEVLYIRPDAKFDGAKPISGGVPHCFPQARRLAPTARAGGAVGPRRRLTRPGARAQFGPGEMQQHGFARNLPWAIASTSADLQPDERDPTVELVLTDNDYTRAMWCACAPQRCTSPAARRRRRPTGGLRARRARPHAFKAVFTVSLHGELLRTDLRVHNTGDASFDFTAALHTYIEVLDIGVAKVRGLQGLRYLDKARPCLPLFAVNDMGRAAPATRRERRCARAQVQDAANPPEATEERTEVGFEGPVDSVYLGAKDYVELDVGTGAAVAIASSGWEDVVVVRPGCCSRFTVGAPMGRGCGLMDFGFANLPYTSVAQWSPWTAMEACYKSFCCVENAKFGSPATVAPGEAWTATQEFAVIDLE